MLATNGRNAQAEDIYRGILRQAPTDVRTRADLAGMLTRAQRYRDARAVLREGLQQTEGNPLLLGALVGVDLREGGIKQALATAEVLKADPKNLPRSQCIGG